MMQHSPPQRVASPVDPRPAGPYRTTTRIRRCMALTRAGWGRPERLRILRTAVRAVSVVTLLLAPARSHGVDPGTAYPSASEASDNRAGSVLIFPFFTASATSPNSESATLTVTNTHDTMVDVRLFFVRGTSGAVNPLATMLLTLPPNAPRSVPASALAPGFRGYVIAVAIEASTDCPIAFNHLIGDVDVKLSTGHFASLPATAVAALYTGTVSGCAAGDASLNFDGVDYNRLPRGLALDNAGSSADGNFTLFVLDHLGGDLDLAITPLGTVNGSFYDDTGTPSAFDFNAPPQFFGTFDPGLPGGGTTTWFEAYPASEVAMVGSTLNFNANVTSEASAFSGGHNLHALTLATDTLALGDAPISTPTRTPTPTGSLSCAGDCNGEGTVTVNELILGVNILLESQPLSACPAFDRNDTGSVTIEELVQGVNNLLGACPL
jgi:hypothetical protein